jgi:hypothetical protein
MPMAPSEGLWRFTIQAADSHDCPMSRYAIIKDARVKNTTLSMRRQTPTRIRRQEAYRGRELGQLRQFGHSDYAICARCGGPLRSSHRAISRQKWSEPRRRIFLRPTSHSVLIASDRRWRDRGCHSRRNSLSANPFPRNFHTGTSSRCLKSTPRAVIGDPPLRQRLIGVFATGDTRS